VAGCGSLVPTPKEIPEKVGTLEWVASEAGISTVLNYPKTLPFYPAYAHLSHVPTDFPVAHFNQSRILSLPIFPEMTNKMIGYVVNQIRDCFNSDIVASLPVAELAGGRA
jgi:dTDP-4-amino-4,6-dideoxygalactose transaminase